MEFKLQPFHRNIPDEELLADLRKVVAESGGDVSKTIYDEDGKFGCAVFTNRFGSWNQALITAGIKRSKVNSIPEESLFENLEEVWLKLGRQPKYDEVKTPLSQYSAAVYRSRFGTWMRALEKFVEFENLSEVEFATEGEKGTYHSGVRVQTRFAFKSAHEKLSERSQNITENDKIYRLPNTTNRSPNGRLRWRVLMRDNFKCVGCGRSPAITPGTILHVDHIIPWSKGGETVLENLQTLCAKCNLGKGNME